jgi:hypothetical protein
MPRPETVKRLPASQDSLGHLEGPFRLDHDDDQGSLVGDQIPIFGPDAAILEQRQTRRRRPFSQRLELGASDDVSGFSGAVDVRYDHGLSATVEHSRDPFGAVARDPDDRGDPARAVQ